MKKLLLLCVFGLITNFMFSQARIGYSEKQIKDEFYDCKFEIKYSDYGQKYITTNDFYRCFVFYYFDENNICSSCLIVPKTSGDLNFYVEEYNKECVIISNTQWKFYTNSGIIDINLIFGDNFTYFTFE